MQLNLDLMRRAVEPAYASMCQHVSAYVSIRQYLVRRAVEPVVAAVYSQEGCEPRERVVNLPPSLSCVSSCTLVPVKHVMFEYRRVFVEAVGHSDVVVYPGVRDDAQL